MTALTPAALATACNRISGDIDSRRWQLADLAAEAKAQNVANWAEVMAACPNVRKAPRTVREWAQVADFRHSLPREYGLSFSFYAAALRMLDRLPLEEIEDYMRVCEENQTITVDSFRAHLSELAQGEPPAFSLADWLSDEWERVRKAREAAPESAGDVLDVLEAAIDTARSRLMQQEGA